MRARGLIESILPLAFLALLFIPLLDNLFGMHLDRTVSTEKRTLAVKPELEFDSIQVLPAKYEAYFNDHFAFRNMLVRGFSILSSEVFDISSVSDVVKGEDGWLYYVSVAQGNSLGDQMGLVCLSDDDLARIASGIEYRKRILDSLGIPFVILIAPDKNSIYPEYLPDNVKRRGPCIKRVDQVIDYLDHESSARVLDVRGLLLEAKRTSPFLIYPKTDTHWSDYGAFLAYQQTVRQLAIKPMAEADFICKEKNIQGGDLAGELSLVDRMREERGVVMEPGMADVTSTVNVRNDYGVGDLLKEHPVIANKDRSLPKLLLFHDSFGGALLKFLPHHFRETVCMETYQFSPNFVVSEKPDVVIFVIVERKVDFLAVRTYH